MEFFTYSKTEWTIPAEVCRKHILSKVTEKISKQELKTQRAWKNELEIEQHKARTELIRGIIFFILMSLIVLNHIKIFQRGGKSSV